MMSAKALTTEHTIAGLLHGFDGVNIKQDLVVSGIALDSRKVQTGDVFLAVAGSQMHGLQHARQAIALGAAAVVWEPVADDAGFAEMAALLPVPVVAVPDLRQRTGIIAERFYGHPSRGLFVIGVTGTDGKTSCSHFIAQALDSGDRRCGVIGTLGYGLFGDLATATHTTPDALTVQQSLYDMQGQGARCVVAEVSSHAMDQGRVRGVDFDIAVLTNLTRDHLDYHGNVEAYAAAKRKLFHADGLRLQTPWGSGHLQSSLLGRFNASNLLAALACLCVTGLPFNEVLRRLAVTRTVAGRMEQFDAGAVHPLVVVDYAHTAGALEAVLGSLRAHCTGKLWCVFGAGGDRDRGKRPLMGAVVERLADEIVLTDDNPRSEDPQQIIDEIRAGLKQPALAHIEHDRAHAITRAMQEAGPDDLVLIAGKGHETVQIVGTRAVPFSDRERVMALVREWSR
jgi:UDP-N-acetylmuramoyl-L-alanyl-D-glutamate--2,6-diaminopimelate ligase